MSKFHSTVSRRTFMKGLGLAGAGLGAAAATVPVFHDVDEIMSSPNATRNWPWYVKERDYFDLTVEVDWAGKERFDSRNSYSFTAEEKAQWISTRADLVVKGIQNNEPGNSLKDHALLAGSAIYTYPPFEGNPEVEFGGIYATREGLGISPWSGTPEEALRMVKTASEFYECRELGVTEINDKSIKCIDANDGKGEPYVFVDTDKPANNLEIPKKCKWVVSWLVPQPASTKFTYKVLGRAGGTRLGYALVSLYRARMSNFIKNLGYQALISSGPVNTQFGVMSGCGETGRINYVIHLDHGALIRMADFLVTDLPLAPTKPMDAGIFRFCETCKKCAELCPGEAISFDGPSYDNVTGPWNAYGQKGWFCHYKKCLPYRGVPGGTTAGGCAQCQVNCVFTKLDKASIHDVIKATVATTPIFNGFFKAMDDAFGYPQQPDPKDFWDGNNRYPFYL